MTPGRDQDDDVYEDEGSRSIFSATWFRALLVFIALAVIAVVALPYALEWASPPAKTPSVARAPISPPLTPPTPAPPPPMATPPTPSPSTTVPVPPPGPPASVAATEPAKASDTAAAKLAEARVVPSVPSPSEPAAMPPATPKPEPPAIVAAAPTPAVAKAPAGTSVKRAALKSSKPKAAATGPFWVQVGAFRDAEAARRVAAKLREANFSVPEPVQSRGAAPAKTASPPPPPPAGDRYEVFVSGTPTSEVNTKVGAKGMTAEGVAGGAVIKPSLALAEAVALSKELGADGLRTEVRRATSGLPPIAPAGNGEALYRVRVGAFPDRTAALAAMRDLESKGYKAFIARGGQ